MIKNARHPARAGDPSSPHSRSHSPTVLDMEARGARSPDDKPAAPVLPNRLRAPLFIAFNVASASGIVFANKIVMSTYGYDFVYFLTLLHTLTTVVGMNIFRAYGMFERKSLSQVALVPLAASYVGYIVLNNLSLKINTVGFYQICKIAIAPTILSIEVIWFRKHTTSKVIASVMVVCTGVAIATVTDSQIISSVVGMVVGFSAVIVTAVYQIWAGTYQKDNKVNAQQLLDNYSPVAFWLLVVVVLAFEPLGIGSAEKDTIVGYPYSVASVATISLSCILGVMVNLSTFLVIGATSSLTYNIVGHIKTVIILVGGYLCFGDELTLKKLAGLAVAMCGIIWYSHLQLSGKLWKLPVVPEVQAANGKDQDV